MRSLVSKSARRLGAEEGYTLTEMLVVIAIIALIAAVLTPQLLGQMSRARAKAAQLQLDTVASAIELFREDVGHYPTSAEGLSALLRDPGAAGWTGPYLKDAKAVKDPWNHDLTYQVETDGSRFSVVSLGADGRQGGSSAARDLRAPALLDAAAVP